jgi:FixJ family two-component response regulator
MGLVILTGYPGQSVAVRGLRAGVDFLIYKPWNDQRLKQTIRRLLHEAGRARAQDVDQFPHDVGGESG